MAAMLTPASASHKQHLGSVPRVSATRAGFYTFVIPDLVDSSVYSAYLSDPFMGMANRDYYLEDDAAKPEHG
jgi:predicted metalloendopeptidase